MPQESEGFNPHACAVAVHERLNELLPKWDPRAPSLGRERREQDDEEGAPVLFNPPPPITHISEGLRIFTKTVPNANPNANVEADIFEVLVEPGELSRNATLSGACIRGSQTDAQAGSGIWYGEQDPKNRSSRLPISVEQTISAAEIAAALYAVQTTPFGTPLNLELGRKTVVDAVGKIESFEDIGWIGVRDSALLKALAASLRARTAETTFSTPAEPTIGTAGVTQLARDGASKDAPDAINMLTACGQQQSSLRSNIFNHQAEIHLLKSEYGESRQLQVAIASNCHPTSYSAVLANLNIALIDIATGADSKISCQNLVMVQSGLKAVYGYLGRLACRSFHWHEWNLKYTDGGLHTMQAFRCLGQIVSAEGDDETTLSLFNIALDGFTFMDIHHWRADCMFWRGHEGRAQRLCCANMHTLLFLLPG
ncbi:hypothetical protein C8J57DRAFT_1656907 [Mycena rebaudengoi]|nr:hypothetical protein C8J57DRAFT_1656907 [Mycena rebaudengoi]